MPFRSGCPSAIRFGRYTAADVAAGVEARCCPEIETTAKKSAATAAPAAAAMTSIRKSLPIDVIPREFVAMVLSLRLGTGQAIRRRSLSSESDDRIYTRSAAGRNKTCGKRRQHQCGNGGKNSSRIVGRKAEKHAG